MGCQTLSPSTSASSVKEWIGEYRRLNQESPSAETCEGFKKLLQKDFELRSFAALRGSKHCGELLLTEEPEPWMKEEWTQVQLELAEKNKDPKILVPLLLEKSLYNLRREEKVQLVQRALDLAQKNKFEKDEIQKIQDRLFLLAPRLQKNYDLKDSLKVAKDFRQAREFPEAQKINLKVLNSNKSSVHQQMAAFEELIRIEKLLHHKEEHIKKLKLYDKFLDRRISKKKFRKLKNLLVRKKKNNEITLVRALWTLGKRSEAEKILHRRIKEKTKSFSYATHYWLLGRIEEEKKNLDESLKWLRLSIKEVQDSSELEGQARWFLAWNLYKAKNYEEAIDVLTWFEESESAEEFSKARALYWKSVSLQKLEKADPAKKQFERLVEIDPLGYYGLLARRELNLPLVKPQPQNQNSHSYFFRRKLRKVFQPDWVDWMTQMKEKESLKNYMAEVTETYAKQPDQDDEVWLVLLQSYAKAGEYLGLFQKLYDLSPETRDRLLEIHPELLFPTPYENEIQAAAKSNGIEPELIYSIIRQESAFNEEARSPADAFGLMQLLPKVARQIGKDIGISVKHYTDLFDPKINIPLGARLIAQQRKRFKGEFISSVASYNASDAAIRGWKEHRSRPIPTEFIEEIPYEETKAYVRLIIRNFSFYHLLLSSQDEALFPETLLASNDSSTAH